MRIVTIASLASALLLGACGSGGSTDNAEDTSLTPLNGAALIEGTTNDSSALETAAETGNTASAPAENATDAGNAM